MRAADTVEMPSSKLQRVPAWKPRSPPLPPPLPWAVCAPAPSPPRSPLSHSWLVRWRRTAQEYCEGGTLHGLKYIGDTHLHYVERFFWLLSFLLAVGAATYYITILYQKWNDPVIVTLSPTTTPLNELPFPAVTVCNMNRAKRSIATRIIESQDRDELTRSEKKLLSALCGFPRTDFNHPSTRPLWWEAVKQFLVKVGQPCHEMLVYCAYGGFLLNCSSLFNSAITDEGICCSFNKVHRSLLFRNPRDLSDLNVTFEGTSADWTPEGGYPPGTKEDAFPLRPMGRGPQLGLTLVLDAQADEYFCSSTASMGFKLMLQNPVETPEIKHMGAVFSPGEELRVVVSPQIQQASDRLRAIPVDKRRCLFSGERPLRFYRTYTHRNCKLECEANFTLQECGCVLPYMPKDSRTPICSTFTNEQCAHMARKVMEISVMGTNDAPEAGFSTRRPTCNCLPGCSELGYTSTIYSSKLWGLRTEYATSGGNATNFRKNMAVVHIFFTESEFTSVLKTEIFGFTDFLSNMGGLLGLFMGFSFISVAEAVYFLTLRLWCVAFRASRDGHVDAEVEARPLEVRPHKKTVVPHPLTLEGSGEKSFMNARVGLEGPNK